MSLGKLVYLYSVRSSEQAQASDDTPIRNSNMSMRNGLSDVECEHTHYHSAEKMVAG